MFEADKKQFAVLMTKLAKAAGRDMDKADMGIYFEALNRRNVSIDQAEYGVNTAIAEFDGLPRPAKLIDFCNQMPRKPLPPTQQLVYTPEQHEDAAARFAELEEMFKDWGNA